MVNIENKVYDTVYTAVTASHTCECENIYSESFATLPHLSLYEADNTTYKASQDENVENHATVMYQLDVYSLDKSDAKSIFATADTAMAGMNFTRISYGVTPNLDRTIYRITARYEAVVSKGNTSGSTTTYSIYRR